MCEGTSIDFFDIALQEKFEIPRCRFKVVKIRVKVLFGEILRRGREATKDLSARDCVGC